MQFSKVTKIHQHTSLTKSASSVINSYPSVTPPKEVSCSPDDTGGISPPLKWHPDACIFNESGSHSYWHKRPPTGQEKDLFAVLWYGRLPHIFQALDALDDRPRGAWWKRPTGRCHKNKCFSAFHAGGGWEGFVTRTTMKTRSSVEPLWVQRPPPSLFSMFGEHDPHPSHPTYTAQPAVSNH